MKDPWQVSSGAAFIMAGNQGHRHDLISTFPFFWMPEVKAFAGAANGVAPAGDTVIGNDVGIGCEAVIMPDIQIADGAVIGTRAVRNVEPYAIVAGNPARLIRKRFDDAQIALLLQMRWWDWADADLAAATPTLTSDAIADLHHHRRLNRA